MNTTLKQDLINKFDNLTSEERDDLIELLLKRRLELQEQEILKCVKMTREAKKNGTAFCGTVEEAIANLLAD
jgi:hypothetical protein